MAWVQLFPTNATRISQSVAQIQANWLFIQQNINTDHYFDAGAPNEGHHRFVHLATQGADPALILPGLVFQKNNVAGNPRLYYRTAAAVMQIPTAITGTTAILAAGTTTNIYNFAGTPACQAIIMMHSTAQVNNRMVGFISWQGGILKVSPMIYVPPYPLPEGVYKDIYAAGTWVQILKATGFAGTATWSIIKIEA